MGEQETIQGFDIPKRVLTKEEKTREVTIDRIREFHYKAGEDFLDTTGDGDAKVFAGFIAHKYKNRASEIYDMMNKEGKYLEIMSFRYFYDPEFNQEEDIDTIYFDFVEFVNTTVHLKERVNQVLIQVSEYYND